MNTTGSGIAHKKERNFEREKKKLKEIEKYFALILCLRAQTIITESATTKTKNNISFFEDQAPKEIARQNRKGDYKLRLWLWLEQNMQLQIA